MGKKAHLFLHLAREKGATTSQLEAAKSVEGQDLSWEAVSTMLAAQKQPDLLKLWAQLSWVCAMCP